MTDINDLVPALTAGQLPSSLTESLLQRALESDNINEVKAQLAHIWGHYQALEFSCAAKDQNLAIADKLIAQHPELAGRRAEVLAHIYAGGVVMAAYETAHEVTDDPLYMLGMVNLPDVLRSAYDFLDHTPPC